jgi:hypothetical protein
MYLAVRVQRIFKKKLRDTGFEDWKMNGTGSGFSPVASFDISSVGPPHSVTRES